MYTVSSQDGGLVDEISCGAFLCSLEVNIHMGNDANGRLGHGDVEDKITPTLVETLNYRHVKSNIMWS